MNDTTLARLSQLSRATHRMFTVRSLYRLVLERCETPTLRLPVAMGALKFPMQLQPLDYVDFHLYYYGFFEAEKGRWLAAILEPGAVMFDLGAHIGYYTVAAGHLVGETGQVHAFEPIPSTHRRLVTNVDLNALHNVRANACAVSESAGSVAMYDLPGNSGGNSFARHATSTTSFEVRTLALDDYVRACELGRLDLIKMDIEGAEVLALRGMRQVLRRFRPHLLLEINPPCLRRLGFAPGDVVQGLRAAGYALVDVKTRKALADEAQIVQACDVHAIPVERAGRSA